jgi:hypothetical protein
MTCHNAFPMMTVLDGAFDYVCQTHQSVGNDPLRGCHGVGARDVCPQGPSVVYWEGMGRGCGE